MPLYSNAEMAALYNQLNPWGPSDDFYLPLVMASDAVLDVGCGTGMMLHTARAHGHRGRLVGIDPDRAALALAREREDIEWLECRAEEMSFCAGFDLAIMISHGFQFLVTDDAIERSLTAIHRALRPDGRFAFETRNPLMRAWEGWAAGDPDEIVDPDGRRIVSHYETELIESDVVHLREVISDPDGSLLRVETCADAIPLPGQPQSFPGRRRVHGGRAVWRLGSLASAVGQSRNHHYCQSGVNKNGADGEPSAPLRHRIEKRLAALITGDVLQEGEVPGSLDGHGQFALLPCRAMCLAARQNLAPLVQTHLKTLDVLVIDHLVVGEDSLLAPASSTATTTARSTGLATISGWARRTITSGACSEARSLLRSALGRLVRLLVIHTD